MQPPAWGERGGLLLGFSRVRKDRGLLREGVLVRAKNLSSRLAIKRTEAESAAHVQTQGLLPTNPGTK